MRAFVFASILSLLVAGRAEAAPQRVASLNLCTDELLLMLAEPGQIASVTHLSQSAEETPLWRLGRRHRSNDGSLLSVTDVERGIALVGVALGRPDRARALLSRIAGLERTRPSGGTDTIWLGGGGRSVGVAGLAAEWMALAGFRQRALRGDRVSLEQLLVSPPRVLLRSDYRSGQYSGEQRWLSHPLARGTRASRTIATDGRRWTCMGPTMIDEIARLREVRR